MSNKRKNDGKSSLADLRNLFSEQTEAAIQDRIRLRDAVCAYYAAEDARGTPARTIEATLSATLIATDGESDEERSQFVRELLDWCERNYQFSRTRGNV